MVEIGKPKRRIRIEPLPKQAPVREPEREPVREPVRGPTEAPEPARREKVPA